MYPVKRKFWNPIALQDICNPIRFSGFFTSHLSLTKLILRCPTVYKLAVFITSWELRDGTGPPRAAVRASVDSGECGAPSVVQLEFERNSDLVNAYFVGSEFQRHRIKLILYMLARSFIGFLHFVFFWLWH